ncbi:MAG: hypothetical protein ACK5D7_02630, partial [Planctomycetota bacterium]
TGSGTESSSEDTAAYRPLIIGTQSQVTVDVSRLPRIDQYNAFMLGIVEPQSARPADIKSVSYFLSESPPADASAEFDPQVSQLGGLYRRQIDRAVASYRGEYEAPTVPDEYCKLVAPEVVALEFRYFDGTDWASEWNSDDMAYFPTAIEIILTVDASRIQLRGRSAAQPLNFQAQLNNLQQYRKVVHLPAAEVPEEEE